jgi:hypothetical protein
MKGILMSALLVLLFPALGFAGAGFIARAFYQFEKTHHDAEVVVKDDGLVDFELMTMLDVETLTSSRS